MHGVERNSALNAKYIGHVLRATPPYTVPDVESVAPGLYVNTSSNVAACFTFSIGF